MFTLLFNIPAKENLKQRDMTTEDNDTKKMKNWLTTRRYSWSDTTKYIGETIGADRLKQKKKEKKKRIVPYIYTEIEYNIPEGI